MQVNFSSYTDTAARPCHTHPLVIVAAPPPHPPLIIRKQAGHNGILGPRGKRSSNGAAPEYRYHPRHEAP